MRWVGSLRWMTQPRRNNLDMKMSILIILKRNKLEVHSAKQVKGLYTNSKRLSALVLRPPNSRTMGVLEVKDPTLSKVLSQTLRKCRMLIWLSLLTAWLCWKYLHQAKSKANWISRNNSHSILEADTRILQVHPKSALNHRLLNRATSNLQYKMDLIVNQFQTLSLHIPLVRRMTLIPAMLPTRRLHRWINRNYFPQLMLPNLTLQIKNKILTKPKTLTIYRTGVEKWPLAWVMKTRTYSLSQLQ